MLHISYFRNLKNDISNVRRNFVSLCVCKVVFGKFKGLTLSYLWNLKGKTNSYL